MLEREDVRFLVEILSHHSSDCEENIFKEHSAIRSFSWVNYWCFQELDCIVLDGRMTDKTGNDLEGIPA